MKKLLKKGVLSLVIFASLSTGSIAYAITWDNSAYWKLDESSGNAFDISGGGHTLTNTGTATYSAGIINNGINITATGPKYLSRADTSGWTVGGPVTISFWYKPTSQPATNGTHTLFQLGGGSTYPYVAHEIYYADASGTKQITINRGQSCVTNNLTTFNQTLSNGTLYHLVYTYDGTNENFYVNGSLVSGPTAKSGNGVACGANITVLGARGDIAFFAEGLEDEVGIWNRAITSGEVTTLYNSGNGLSYPSPSNTPNRLAKFIDGTTVGDALFSDDGVNTTLTGGNLFTQPGSLFDAVSNGILNFGTGTATTMTFGRSGQNMLINSKLGIGTTTPTAMLEVGGDFFSNLIKVAANGFGLDTLTAGELSIGSTTASTINIGRTGITTTIPGAISFGTAGTVSNCNSSTSPASCASAPSGSVALATGGSTLVVNTSAVTANSQILITEDSSLGSRLGITCNTGTGRNYSINARTAGTSFTIKSSANPTTNKACLSYWIIN